MEGGSYAALAGVEVAARQLPSGHTLIPRLAALVATLSLTGTGGSGSNEAGAAAGGGLGWGKGALGGGFGVVSPSGGHAWLTSPAMTVA
jgi:hypothetical protein